MIHGGSAQASPSQTGPTLNATERITRVVLDRTTKRARLRHTVTGVAPGDVIALNAATKGLAPIDVRAHMPSLPSGGVLNVSVPDTNKSEVLIATLPETRDGKVGRIAETHHLHVEYNALSEPWNVIHRVFLSPDATRARIETCVILENSGSRNWERTHVALASGGRVVYTLPAPLDLARRTVYAVSLDAEDDVKVQFETIVAACGSASRVLDIYRDSDRWLGADTRVEVYDSDGAQVFGVDIGAIDMRPIASPEGALLRVVYERDVVARIEHTEYPPRQRDGAMVACTEYRLVELERSRFGSDSLLVQHRRVSSDLPAEADLGDGGSDRADSYVRMAFRGHPVYIYDRLPAERDDDKSEAAAIDNEPGQAGEVGGVPSVHVLQKQQQEEEEHEGTTEDTKHTASDGSVLDVEEEDGQETPIEDLETMPHDVDSSDTDGEGKDYGEDGGDFGDWE